MNALTRQYDRYEVPAVLNEIAGRDHTGQQEVGTPSVFGMNFQSVSTAQKLPLSGGQQGGYTAGDSTPGPLLQGALDFVDTQVGALVQGLREAGRYGDTAVILSAKHGQAPTDGDSLKRIDDGAVLDGLNAAWQRAFPAAPQPLVAASLDDDGMLLWFSSGDRTPTADRFATDYLTAYAGSGTGTDGRAKATDLSTAPVAYTSAGLAAVDAGPAAAALIGATPDDPRVPDLIGLVQHGVVHTGKTKKIAEHGGNDPQDRDVPLVVSRVRRGVQRGQVETTQVAPTILALLGLDPRELQAVRVEGTAALRVRAGRG